MSEECDVLICGSGSAGLCAAVWLARAGINFKILERREGMLKQGQADGVQVRTVEILEHLGLSEDVLKEACHVLELAFWSPDGNGGIRRSHLEPDTEPGLSHLPHVILSQARINEFLIQDIVKSSGQSHIRYNNEIYEVVVDSEAAQDPNAHCVTVKSMENGVERTYRAKYALGCDGAHSAVRKSLGFKMIGDSTDVVWAVMDVYPRTDFPDIRKKCVLQSDAGNLLIIPREGDEKVRFYMEMPVTTTAEVTPEKVKERLDCIFKPYQVEIAETSWFSAYSIGQRLADHFTKDHRVFLTGDACHTHSPKAGQGMNVSLQDGYNIGWKLSAVLRGQAHPSILETYVSERHHTAKDLIDFDRQFAKMFSSSYRKAHGYSTKDFQEYFIKSGRYTAGLAIQYKPSILVKTGEHDDLACGISPGMRFPSAQVVRFSDAKAMPLSQTLEADSRWSLAIFPGDIAQKHAEQRLVKLAKSLEVVLRRFDEPQKEMNSFLNPILVLKSDRKSLNDKKIPKLFTPYAGKWRVKCLQNIFVDDESYHAGHGQAYARYGVDPEVGAMVLIRPDQYVSEIYALENTKAITTFFEPFLVRMTNGTHKTGTSYNVEDVVLM
ncbi:FAD binding domain-containing protein [Colletotrichum graminicola M1.001]|uniref:FAD binding domain-containing protein n=1 Tax=Colletotrichum graminicola (strain M1.001 / M2 / FGSC 10212) TaxID=645133 RepID=E3QPK1_COLGM|nr:FAD binding domain-containing protein [Colletotrichum graminicola M1.001]EFQ32906.1 FAD binding domain-containing protein [Colletotrichum graminicola M1.001]